MHAQWTQGWWVWAIRGVVAVFFGVIALVFPAPSMPLAMLLLGAYLQLDGLAAIGIAACFGLHNRTALPLACIGLLGLIGGMVILIWPGFSNRFLVLFLGIYCVARGGLELVNALRVRAQAPRNWNFILASVFALGFGSLLLVRPDLQPITLAWAFPAFVILTGICLITAALHLRGLDAEIVTTDPYTQGWRN
jgi:uncharacterized membrane protein HdeD (DUF308 family)